MARTMFSVRLPDEMLAAIDARRKEAGGLTRTEWTERALTYLLSLPIRERTLATKERV